MENKPDMKNELLSAMMQSCSRKEMCRFEVAGKLDKWNISESGKEEIINKLEEGNFLNEERYTGFFIRDKLKFNKWGRIKIRYLLKSKKISENTINKCMNEIDDAKYLEILRSELGKKQKISKYGNKDIDKLVRFAQSRGFELDIILSVLRQEE